LKHRIKKALNQLRTTRILSNFFNLSGIQFSNILLAVLIIPIVTRAIGIDGFGIMMYASRFSWFVVAIVNYGTGQSAVRDVAFHIHDKQNLARVFYETLFLRTIMFALFLALMFALQWFNILYYTYLLLAIPIVLAEVFNPLCFFIGAERLKLFNLCNLLSNVVAIITIILCIKSNKDTGLVNFILGMANTLTYLGLLIYFGRLFKLPFYVPTKAELVTTGKHNFSLTVNNLSVNLQQSIIIFALPRWGYTALLGPYTLADRIIGQCRNLLITISNAIYPNAAHIYKSSTEIWDSYRRKNKFLLAALFLAGAILLFIIADPVVYLLSKKHNDTAVMVLRIMAAVPVLSALNVLNVMDQLLKNNTAYIFRIAVILFIVAIAICAGLLASGNTLLIASFTLLVETAAWLMYEFVVNKKLMQK